MKKRSLEQHSEEYKAKICIEQVICFLQAMDGETTDTLRVTQFLSYLDGKIVNRDQYQREMNRGYVAGSYDRKHPTIYDIIAENEVNPL